MHIPTGASKLLAGGGAVVFATAAAAGQLPIPAEIGMPEGHTALDVLFMAMVAYALNQTRLLNKKVEEGTVEAPSAKPENVNMTEFVQKQLEKIAEGVEKTADDLTAHRLDFASFRGNVVARLDNLENRS